MDLSQELSQLRAEFDALDTQSQDLDSRTDKTLRNMQKIADESNRVADVAHNAPKILDDLDREFEQKTKLNGLDITFMFIATAVQCARWYILSNDKFRLTSSGGDKMMAKIVPKNWQNILLSSVPYDAVKRDPSMIEDGILTGLGGGTHRYKTLGHDPIMGWIFGPVNILSDSLTTYDIVTSYNVRNNLIAGAVPTPQVFSAAFQQIQADKMNLPAAIVRQALHFGSDYFTKQGLPLPFIMTADNDLAAQMLTKFHVDMWSVTRGAALASLVNAIVGWTHSLFYDPAKYSSPRVYEVKTRKIIRYSNIISSTSNVIYTAISGDLLRLDVGGILVTLWRIIRDRKFQQEVKREFITERFNELIRGEEYDFE
ncbi:MAG: hypothetical protein IJP86_04690 [Synergistaceae bacterium]|nr:hypothetical protein [Synergistaceae bacterium]